jgi:hypothetical protein
VSTLFTPQSIVPIWFVVVGLVALLQPPVTVTGNILLLVVGGVVAPEMFLFLMNRWQPALADRLHATRTKERSGRSERANAR